MRGNEVMHILLFAYYKGEPLPMMYASDLMSHHIRRVPDVAGGMTAAASAATSSKAKTAPAAAAPAAAAPAAAAPAAAKPPPRRCNFADCGSDEPSESLRECPCGNGPHHHFCSINAGYEEEPSKCARCLGKPVWGEQTEPPKKKQRTEKKKGEILL